MIEVYQPYEFTWCRDDHGMVWICYHSEPHEQENEWGGLPLYWYAERTS